ncbi:hypothetical protein FAZ78_19600, partial [Cereibacter changlensis]
ATVDRRRTSSPTAPPTAAEQLRINVTSPRRHHGRRAAVLMDPETGFPPLLRRAVKAAADRGRELGQ